jgi:hypothetical protein
MDLSYLVDGLAALRFALSGGGSGSLPPAEYDGFQRLQDTTLFDENDQVGDPTPMTLQDAREFVEQAHDVDAFVFEQPRFGDANTAVLQITFYRRGRLGPKDNSSGSRGFYTYIQTPRRVTPPPPVRVTPGTYAGFKRLTDTTLHEGANAQVGGEVYMTLQEAITYVKASDVDSFVFKQPAFGDANTVKLEVTFYRNGRQGPKDRGSGSAGFYTYIQTTPPPSTIAPAEYAGFKRLRDTTLYEVANGQVGDAFGMTLRKAMAYVESSDVDAFVFEQPAFGDANTVELEVTFYRNGRRGPKDTGSGSAGFYTYIQRL